jgi:flagellar capping protein FliD
MDASIQLALSIGVPTLAVLVGILINNSRLGDLNGRFNDLNGRFNDLNNRLSDLRAEMNTRFDDMKDMWRSELHRVEEVLDARLKHLEER